MSILETAMFWKGPKSRTTTAVLAILAGWAGAHKFYLGHHNAGASHVALTWVGLIAIVGRALLPDMTVVIFIMAWLAVILGYFYVRRFQLGHTMEEVLSPVRLLLWPWRLLRYTFRLSGKGMEVMDAEDEAREERREWLRWRRREWSRRRRGRRWRREDDDYDDDRGSGCSLGLVIFTLGLVLSLALVGAVITVYILIFAMIGFIAIAGSVIIGAAEGVRHLTRSDSDFERDYVVGQRLWF